MASSGLAAGGVGRWRALGRARFHAAPTRRAQDLDAHEERLIGGSTATGAAEAPPLPRWLWLWLPIALVLMQVGAKAVGHSFYRRWMRSETGLVEILTVAFLIVAVAAALRLFALRGRVGWRPFRWFALALAAGCLFFAGEEASWGQHWIGFEPPERLVDRNDQGEFNLHNDPLFGKLLDQIPRTILTLAALLGGVLAPLLRRRRPAGFARRDPWGWILPTIECLPAALIAVAITLPEKLFELTTGDVPYSIEISAGETKELGLALFLMLYMLVLARALAATE